MHQIGTHELYHCILVSNRMDEHCGSCELTVSFGVVS